MRLIELDLNQIKEIYTKSTTIVADKHYPKGNKHRGKFLLDQALIFNQFQEELKKLLGTSSEQNT